MKQKYLLQLTFQGLRVALNNSMFGRLDLYLENKHGRYKLNGVNFNGGLELGL